MIDPNWPRTVLSVKQKREAFVEGTSRLSGARQEPLHKKMEKTTPYPSSALSSENCTSTDESIINVMKNTVSY